MPEIRTPVLTGGCQCGAVRYTLYAPPVGTLCHCRMCQKAVGGPFAALATLPRADFAWTKGAPAHFQSSSVASRGFCAACGTPLTYEGTNDPNKIDIMICSLDNPEAVPPRDQYGVESRVTWFDTLAGLPASRTDAKYDGVVSLQHPDFDPGP